MTTQRAGALGLDDIEVKPVLVVESCTESTFAGCGSEDECRCEVEGGYGL